MKRGISVLLFLILVIVLSLNFISAGFFDSLKEFFNPFITGKAVDEKIGLVSHWPFENNYNDNVGNNHGSINGNPVFIEGKVGKSLKFDGNDYIKTDIKNLDLQSAFTISAWINAESSSSFQTILAKEQDSPEGWSNRNFWFALWDNGKLTLKFSSLSNNNDCEIIGGSDLRNKGWKHVVGVYDGSNCKIYVDGGLVGSDAVSGKPEGIGHPLLIGLESNYRKRGFKGAIDEVKIWDRALSNEEIKDEYDGNSKERGITGRGVTIGIIDTGVDYTHEDFGGCTNTEECENTGLDITDNSGLFPNSKVIGGYDFVNDDNDPMDDVGHGTHVAGIAAGKGRDKNNNSIYCEYNEGEICGVAPDATIYAFKDLIIFESGVLIVLIQLLK